MVWRDFISALFLFREGKGQKYKRVACTKNCYGLANRTSILSSKRILSYATTSILALGKRGLIYSDFRG
jgi:hypothetical protein